MDYKGFGNIMVNYKPLFIFLKILKLKNYNIFKIFI